MLRMLRTIRMKTLLGFIACVLATPTWAFLWTYSDNACANYYWTAPNVQAYQAWKQAGLVDSYINAAESPPICRQ